MYLAIGWNTQLCKYFFLPKLTRFNTISIKILAEFVVPLSKLIVTFE